MKRNRLCAKAGRKFKATTNSKHSLPIAPNLLEQRFNVNEPNRAWVGDITYLHTNEGWLYLAVVIDLFSRKVIGWSMDKTMTKTLVADAFQMVLWKRNLKRDLIFHSDRGSQYCSGKYQALFARHDIRANMSAKGNCYDNAVAESFFHSMKVKAIHGEQFLPGRKRNVLYLNTLKLITIVIDFIHPLAISARWALKTNGNSNSLLKLSIFSGQDQRS